MARFTRRRQGQRQLSLGQLFPTDGPVDVLSEARPAQHRQHSSLSLQTDKYQAQQNRMDAGLSMLTFLRSRCRSGVWMQQLASTWPTNVGQQQSSRSVCAEQPHHRNQFLKHLQVYAQRHRNHRSQHRAAAHSVVSPRISGTNEIKLVSVHCLSTASLGRS